MISEHWKVIKKYKEFLSNLNRFQIVVMENFVYNINIIVSG
jgi:hypothetical protein